MSLNQINPDVNLADLFDSSDAFNCRYFTIDTFKQTELDSLKYNLSLICLNIRTFTKNIDEFLGFLINSGHVFGVIVITETWARDDTHHLCHISCYNSAHNFRENKRSGGVSTFVREALRFENIDALNISNDFIECAGINVSNSITNIFTAIVSIYQKNTGNIRHFINNLDEIITTKDTLITGGFEHLPFERRF